MKNYWWIPRAGAWASAVALFVYALGVSFAMAAIMPYIAEVMRQSPRLGWLAVLATWTAPIVVAAGAHHAAHGVLDLRDVNKVARWPSSLWTGFVAWVAIIFVSMTASFVMLVIDPPPVDPDALAMVSLESITAGGARAIIHAIVWLVLAAQVYTLERAARRDV